MKVLIETAGRYDNPAVKDFLNQHKKLVEKVLRQAVRKYKIRLPHLVILRPFYWRGVITACRGRVLYNYRGQEEYQILLTYEKLKDLPDKGRETVIHECSHIIEHLMYDKMSHGEKFRRIFADFRL